MLNFVIRRGIAGIPLLLASTVVAFLLVVNSGDPLAALKQSNPPPSEAALAVREHELGLDLPLPLRYFKWLGGVLVGDFGTDNAGNPVGPQLFAAADSTFRLVVAAAILAVLLGIAGGVIAAVRQYSWIDNVVTVTGFIFIAMPVFWFAGLLKDLAVRFNNTVGTSVIQYVGQESTPPKEGFAQQLDIISHLILPTIALAAVSYATYSRYMRSSMLEVLGADYMRLARAKGLRWNKVLIRHGLRTSLIPLTTVVALDFGSLIGGAVITEAVFGWKGMGKVFIDGMNTVDVNVILGWFLIVAASVILFTIIADILYAVLDPRVRLS